MLRKATTLSAALIFSGFVSAGDQIINPEPISQDISPNQAVNFDVNYSTKNPIDATLTGIGVRLHWDSSVLTFNELNNLFSTSLLVQGTPENDSSDFDNDSNTDQFINMSWVDFSGNWPGDTWVTLYTANFTTRANFTGDTSVKFSSSSTASGFSLSTTSAMIKTPVTLIDVPSVIGQSQSSASADLKQVGTITTQYHLSIKSGRVINQNPTSGVSTTVNSTVNLIVSSGSGLITVPSVIGQTQVSASNTLTMCWVNIRHCYPAIKLFN